MSGSSSSSSICAISLNSCSEMCSSCIANALGRVDRAHLLRQHLGAAARHRDPVAILVIVRIGLWSLAEGKVQLEIGSQRLVFDIAAEHTHAIQLTGVGDIAECLAFAFKLDDA